MKYKLLLVDDESLILKGLTKIMDWNALNCDVIGTARDGEEALQLIQKHRPQLVITDIRMPKKSGIDLLRDLQSLSNRPAVILLSGYNEFEYARQGLQYGAADYILKPIDYEELHECVFRVTQQFEQKGRNDYEQQKARIYEAITLGSTNESLRDETSFYIVLSIRLHKPTSEAEQVLHKWCKEQGEDILSRKVFLFKLTKDQYTIVFMETAGEYETLNMFGKQAAQQLFECLDKQCKIAIGRPVTGLAALSLSYQQVNEYLESSAFFKMSIITDEDIKKEYKSKSTPSAIIEKAESYLKEKFTEDISVDSVAEIVGLSESHFGVLFKQKTGKTFLEYVTNLRIQHACVLLKTTDLKTYEIANLIGYVDQRYFSQVFKRKLGMTPSEYRKQIQ